MSDRNLSHHTATMQKIGLVTAVVTLGAICTQYAYTYINRHQAQHRHSADPSNTNTPLSALSYAEYDELVNGDHTALQHIHSVPFGRAAREQLFQLNKHSNFLNHGSFGTVPMYVMSHIHALHHMIEQHPDLWHRHENYQLTRTAARAIAPSLGNNISADDIVFVNNATSACNAVLHSLQLSKGDVLITYNTTYNACKNAMKHICDRHQCHYVEIELSVPIDQDMHLRLMKQTVQQYDVSRIKFVLIDTISSPIPACIPYRQVSQYLQSLNIPVFLDAAHSIGQQSSRELDVSSIGCTWMTSNIHKWLFAGKGCAILWCTDTEQQSRLYPLVTSHNHYATDWKLRFWQQGTRDDVSYISAIHAVQFADAIGRHRMETYNRDLSDWATQYLQQQFNTQSDSLFHHTMIAPNMKAIRLPFLTPSVYKYHNGNTDQYTVEQVHDSSISYCVSLTLLLSRDPSYDTAIAIFYVAATMQIWCRISTQIYNTTDDYIRFAQTIKQYAKTLNQQ